MKRGPSGALLGALLLAVAAPAARGEVRIELNPEGNVRDLVLDVDVESGLVWTKTSAVPDRFVLNANGDSTGDGLPTGDILALPTMPSAALQAAAPAPSAALRGRAQEASQGLTRTGLVAWSRWDGSDWEIVYSLWDYGTWWWREAAYVEAVDNEVDDTDPRLEVVGSRVFLLWRRSSEASAVMLSTGTLVGEDGWYEFVWTPAQRLALGPGLEDASMDDILRALPRLLGGLGHAGTVRPGHD